jgi:hypothetical protein
MGFAPQGLWVTGYRGLMGYGVQIPAHQLGGPKKAWDFRGYGLSEAWVMGVSTVYLRQLWGPDSIQLCEDWRYIYFLKGNAEVVAQRSEMKP